MRRTSHGRSFARSARAPALAISSRVFLPREPSEARWAGIGTSTKVGCLVCTAASASARASRDPSFGVSARTPRSLCARTRSRSRPSYSPAYQSEGLWSLLDATIGSRASHRPHSTWPSRPHPMQTLDKATSARSPARPAPADLTHRRACTVDRATSCGRGRAPRQCCGCGPVSARVCGRPARCPLSPRPCVELVDDSIVRGDQHGQARSRSNGLRIVGPALWSEGA